MARKKKICPVKDCEERIQRWHRFCHRHFSKLPKALKEKITSDRWHQHLLECIKWLNAHGEEIETEDVAHWWHD